MTDDQFFLGIDVGTTAVKAVVVSQSGTVIGEEEAGLTVSTPRPGWSEQNPEDWWEASVAATRAACANLPAGTGVSGIGLSGQMHTAVFLDQSDRVLRPAILWNDVRTTEQCRYITETVGKRGLRRLVGNPALEGFTAPKILWLRDNEPDSFRRTRMVLQPKDYVRLRMTGERATEPSDAASMLLFDIRRTEWSKEMLDLLDLDRSILPRVVGSAEVSGTLTAGAAADLGLSEGVPVVGGGADNASAAVGAGVVSPGTLLVSTGTSGTVVAPVARPRVDPGMRVHAMNHAAEGTWYLMGVVLSAGAALAWFRRALAPHGGTMPSYDELVAEADTVAPGADGLTFLPYLTGERTPHGDANARGVFCGLHAGHSRGHLTRAVLEGVAFALRDSLDLVRRLGVDAAEAVAVGGGARSPVWRQIHADVFETALVTVGPAGGAPNGAAMLAAAGTGAFATVADAADAWLSVIDRTDPQPETYDAYRPGHERYRKLYRRLKNQFAEGAAP
jgi:xylulokinase